METGWRRLSSYYSTAAVDYPSKRPAISLTKANSLNPHQNPRHNCYPHFTDETTKAKRIEETCSRHKPSMWRSCGSRPDSLAPESLRTLSNSLPPFHSFDEIVHWCSLMCQRGWAGPGWLCAPNSGGLGAAWTQPASPGLSPSSQPIIPCSQSSFLSMRSLSWGTCDRVSWLHWMCVHASLWEGMAGLQQGEPMS